MNTFASMNDTIVAIATPAGPGGIGIVRLSGRESLKIADRMFVARNGKKPSQFKSYTLRFGWVIDDRCDQAKVAARSSPVVLAGVAGLMIDEALLAVMRAPRSYTCEDVVEISCHGGSVVLRAVLNRALDLGARLAEPGEFTKRAFLNGRIDLAQAEAVLDIVRSKSESFLRIGTQQLKGELTRELEAIRERLLAVYTQQEALINFPDEEIEDGPHSAGRACLAELNEIRGRVEKLLATGDQGRVMREGVKVVLCGRTNVGKSSLLNALLRQPRAIVTEIEGTTRDALEEEAVIEGVPFLLVDTAGILQPRDVVEQEAVRRSQGHISSADLVLLVVDASQRLLPEDREVISQVQGRPVLVLFNKCDLPRAVEEDKIRELFPRTPVIATSAVGKAVISDLRAALLDFALAGKSIEPHRLTISNARHLTALKDCSAALSRGIRLLKQSTPSEFVAEEIKAAVHGLDQITGRDVDADLLDKIFSEFCVGK